MYRMLGLVITWLATAMPATADPAADVARWIGELGDASFRVRTEAGRRLQEAGPIALPALREARDHPNAEVRRRAGVLAERMGRELLLSPSRVTLKLTDRPVEEAVKLIAAQTGYRLKSYANGGEAKTVSLDLDGATFWEAIDELSLKAGMTYYADGGDDTAFLREQDTYSPYVHHQGPFRISLVSVDSHRSVQLAHVPRGGDPLGQNPGTLSLSIGVHSERKLPLLQVGHAELTEAVDQNGMSLLPPKDESSPYSRSYYFGGGMYRTFEQHTQAMLQRPHRGSVKIRRLSGNLRVTLLAEERPDIVVQGIAQLEKGEFDGRTGSIRVERGEKAAGGDLVLTIDATFPGTNSFGGDFHQRMVVVDSAGRRYQTNFLEMESGGDYMRATASFAAPGGGKIGPPDRFILYRWVTVAHTVPFEFRDVPLP